MWLPVLFADNIFNRKNTLRICLKLMCWLKFRSSSSMKLATFKKALISKFQRGIKTWGKNPQIFKGGCHLSILYKREMGNVILFHLSEHVQISFRSNSVAITTISNGLDFAKHPDCTYCFLSFLFDVGVIYKLQSFWFWLNLIHTWRQTCPSCCSLMRWTTLCKA